MNRIKGAARWLHDHPWVVVSAGAGLLVGCSLGLGVRGNWAQLATVVSAAVGAGVAVFGTVWAANVQRHAKKAEAQEVISEVFGRLVDAGEAFEEATRATPLNVDVLRERWDALHSAAGAAELQGSALPGAFATLGPRGQLAGIRVTSAVQTLQDHLRRAPQELLQPGNVRLRQAASAVVVGRLVRSSVGNLKKGMRMDIS